MFNLFQFGHSCLLQCSYCPSDPMYGIFPYIWDKFLWLNVGKLPWDVQISHLHKHPDFMKSMFFRCCCQKVSSLLLVCHPLRKGCPLPKKHVVYHPRRLSCLVVWFTFGSRDGEGEKNDSENLEFLSCGVFG